MGQLKTWKEMIYPKNRLVHCQGLLKLHEKIAVQNILIDLF